jgi:uncharacterized protein
MSELIQKEENLKAYLSSFHRLAIAFSAGVDSCFLLKEAQDVLGDNVLAITAHIHSFPRRELKEAESFCKTNHIRHIVLKLDEFEVPGFAENPKDRCYLCKKALFSKMLETAKKEGFSVLAEGSNMDDESDYRPGHKAIAELKIESPLRKANLYKDEIRRLSNKLALPTWDKPALACLSTRIATGEPITKEKLFMIERAEEVLKNHGFRQFRVRLHGEDLARIEVSQREIDRFGLKEVREKLVTELKRIGFRYVSVDLEGYRTGSMNSLK